MRARRAGQRGTVGSEHIGEPAALERISDEGHGPDPLIHPDTEPFWQGLERGELRAQRCKACGTWRYPFAPVCHRCLSFEATWEPLSADGRVAAAVIVRRPTGDQIWAGRVPFASGIVDLEHDLRLPGRILCQCGAGLRKGAVVRAVVVTSRSQRAVLAFRHDCPTPARPSAATPAPAPRPSTRRRSRGASGH